MRRGCLRGGTGQEGRRRARAGGWGRTCRHSGVHGTTANGDSPIPGPLSTKTAPANEHLLSSAHPEHDKHSNAAPPQSPQESSCKAHDWRAPNLRTGSLGIWHCPSLQPIPADCSSLPEGGPAATSPPGRRWPRGSPRHLPASISLAHGSPLPSNPQLPWAHAPLGSGVRQLGPPGAI